MERSAKRRRWSSRVTVSSGDREVASSAAKPWREREIWLDKLPLDVCERIAQSVCKGQQNDSALFLAQTSASQRRAVLNVLDHRLEIEESYGGDLVRNNFRLHMWIDIFKDDVEKLKFDYYRELEPANFTLPLIALPKVRVVHIEDYPAHLSALVQSTSVTDVFIDVKGRTPPLLIFQALAKITLCKLELSCEVRLSGNNPCVFEDEDAFPDDAEQNALAICCPHLKALRVKCLCLKKVVHPIWGIVPTLRSLSEMAVSWCLMQAPIPDEAIRFLGTLESVKLDRVDLSLARQVGSSVTQLVFELDNLRNTLSDEEVAILAEFPRLQSVQCNLEAGAELALPDLADSLPLLRSLSLTWACKPRCACAVPRPQDFNPYGGCDVLPTAPPLLLLHAVELAPNLSELHLLEVRIELTELKLILRSVGPRLRRFSTTVEHQPESKIDRVDALIRAATRYNFELRQFGLNGLRHHSVYYIEEKLQVRDRARAMRILLRQLETRAPFLDPKPLLIFIDSMTYA